MCEYVQSTHARKLLRSSEGERGLQGEGQLCFSEKFPCAVAYCPFTMTMQGPFSHFFEREREGEKRKVESKNDQGLCLVGDGVIKVLL